MQQVSKMRNAFKLSSVIALCATLFSFSDTGGDSFEIYLNNHLVFQQFVARPEPPKSVQLDQTMTNAQLTVYYNHCGQTGKSRSIVLKDDQNRILRTWHFSDASGNVTGMLINVNEILGLQKKINSNKLYLYYNAQQLEGKERLLAAVLM